MTGSDADIIEAQPAPASFSQEDIDRIISERLAKAQAKHDTEMRALREESKRTLERAKMDEEQRIAAEREDERQALTRRAEEAEHRLRLVSAERELARSGLPVELAEAVLGGDDKTTAENVARLVKAVEERANALYTERVGRSGAPEAPVTGDKSSDDLRARMRAAAGLSEPTVRS